MTVDYDVWEADDGSMAMIEFEPDYFKEQVSTEVKDLAKDRGLIYFQKENWKIVLTEGPEKAGDLLDAFGIEDYLVYRMNDLESRWEYLAQNTEQYSIDSFNGGGEE